MIVDFNEITEILERDIPGMFSAPGVIRGQQGSVVLTREELKTAFHLPKEKAGGYAELVGLGFGRDGIVGAGDKKMPAARLEARLREIRDRQRNLGRSASEGKGQHRGSFGVLRRR